MPTPTEHALLSASSAHRWLACTAAPRFEEQFPNGTSDYAEEGSLAHSICELYARKHFSTMTNRKFNADLKKLQAKPYYSDEMLKTAEAYVEYLTEKAMAYPTTPYVTQEVKVDFSDYVPQGFGTCDCVMIGGDTLHITDYKHGKGVEVSAVENPQMRLYALGALKMFAPVFGDSIKKVSMGICQPRITDDESEDSLTVEELKAWGEGIKPIALEAYNGPGTFCPGEHCRFCKGKAQCRARADQNTAFEDFKDFAIAGKAAPELQALSPEARAVIGLPPMLSDMQPKNKHFLSLYYGVDESLADDVFLAEIQKINSLIEDSLRKMKGGSPMSVIKSNRSESEMEFIHTARQLQIYTIQKCVGFPKRYTFYVSQPIADILTYQDIYASWQSWKAYAQNFNAYRTIQSMGELYNRLFVFPCYDTPPFE